MRLFTRNFAVVITATVFLSACSNAGLSKGGVEMAHVPITDQPSGEIYPGKFVWHDLLTPDIQAAGTFYEKLFGWQIDYDGEYAVVSNGGKQIAGILQIKPSDDEDGDGEGVWIPSVSVSDVDKAANRLSELGGEIVNGPVDMSPRGRAALVKDFQGAYLVLLRAKGGDPVDTDAAIGDWLWDEIWTQDVDDTEMFYAAVLGFDEMVTESGYDVFMYKGDGRAGMRDMESESQPPLWVPVVRVADPAVMVKRVPELGGVVWVDPDEAPTKGETALIGDSTGALLLIQRWPSQASEGEK